MGNPNRRAFGMNLRISWLCSSPHLLGRWYFRGLNENEGWEEVRRGKGDAYRRVRIGKRRYWVGISYGQVTGIARLLTFGQPYFAQYTLYRNNPSAPYEPGNTASLGDGWPGRLGRALKELEGR